MRAHLKIYSRTENTDTYTGSVVIVQDCGRTFKTMVIHSITALRKDLQLSFPDCGRAFKTIVKDSIPPLREDLQLSFPDWGRSFNTILEHSIPTLIEDLQLAFTISDAPSKP